jgi:hypothetical protein
MIRIALGVVFDTKYCMRLPSSLSFPSLPAKGYLAIERIKGNVTLNLVQHLTKSGT